MTQIKIMSAKDAFYSIYLGGPFRSPYTLFSIMDHPENSPIQFREVGYLKNVQPIHFVDIPPSELEGRPNLLKQAGFKIPTLHNNLICKIINQAKLAQECNYDILVHCEAGASRSRAVGQFLEFLLNHNAQDYLKNIHASNFEFLQLMIKEAVEQGLLPKELLDLKQPISEIENESEDIFVYGNVQVTQPQENIDIFTKLDWDFKTEHTY